jgi:hypothetical protein
LLGQGLLGAGFLAQVSAQVLKFGPGFLPVGGQVLGSGESLLEYGFCLRRRFLRRCRAGDDISVIV